MHIYIYACVYIIHIQILYHYIRSSIIVYKNKAYYLRGYAGCGNISNILKNVKKYYLKNIKYILL